MTWLRLIASTLLAVPLVASNSLAISAWAQSKVKVLPVTIFGQETPSWCWAATGQMIMNYLSEGGFNAPQCYQANQEFSTKLPAGTDCCSCPTPAGCVKGGMPQFSTWGFTSKETTNHHHLSWPEVMAQIDGGKPFKFSWDWNKGGGHDQVATGYAALSENERFVIAVDPEPYQERCAPGGSVPAGNATGPFSGRLIVYTYETYVGGKNYNHTHGGDTYDIVRK